MIVVSVEKFQTVIFTPLVEVMIKGNFEQHRILHES